MRVDYLLYICDITGRERVMVSLDVTEGWSGRTEEGDGANGTQREGERQRERERVD